jgi:hypothetical protein
LSRPAHEIRDWYKAKDRKHKHKALSNKTQAQTKKPARYVNWLTPFCWSQIQLAGRKTKNAEGLSPSGIVQWLHCLDKSTFCRLRKSTVADWIEKRDGVRDWKESVLLRAKRGNIPGHDKGGCHGVLVKRLNVQWDPILMAHTQAPYPEIVETIKCHLVTLRDAGAPLSLVAVRAIIVATVQKYQPELFQQTFKDGSTFRVSDTYCRNFLHGTMKWSERKATKAAQKRPNNWEDVCERAFLRRAYIIKEEDIPSTLIVNSDQTGVVYGPGSKLTWAPRGSKQVSLIGADEKRAFTALLSISTSGYALPIQAVFEGLTDKSCPNPAARHYANCIEAGFRLVPSEKKGNHWSNQQTMRHFVNEILAPYFDAQKALISRPQSQKSLWIIDVWSVHRSEEFMSWMRDKHPTILIDFVPGGCTGMAQPLDVGVNRPFKQSIKVSYHADLVDDFLGQMKDNESDGELKFDAHIGALRDASIGWIWNAYRVIQNKVLIEKVRNIPLDMILCHTFICVV